MKPLFLPAGILLCALFVGGCATVSETSSAPTVLVPGDSSAPSQVTPSEALATAERYARHPWRPFARNIRHIVDGDGIRVDTPDIGYKPVSGRDGWWVPGEVNRGIPYKWGGFDSLASFDTGVGAGLAAGDVSSPAKRQANNKAVSAFAVGLDCSGYISRCLKLPRVYDTAELPTVCDVLKSASDLQPGDLLNIPRQHVLLIAGWARPDRSWVYYYETGGIPNWKPDLKEAPLASLMALGYQPLRYRGMARESLPAGKEVLTRSAKARAISLPYPVIGEP